MIDVLGIVGVFVILFAGLAPLLAPQGGWSAWWDRRPWRDDWRVVREEEEREELADWDREFQRQLGYPPVRPPFPSCEEY